MFGFGVDAEQKHKERKEKEKVKTSHTLPTTKKSHQSYYLKQYIRYCPDKKKENGFFGSVL